MSSSGWLLGIVLVFGSSALMSISNIGYAASGIALSEIERQQVIVNNLYAAIQSKQKTVNDLSHQMNEGAEGASIVSNASASAKAGTLAGSEDLRRRLEEESEALIGIEEQIKIVSGERLEEAENQALSSAEQQVDTENSSNLFASQLRDQTNRVSMLDSYVQVELGRNVPSDALDSAEAQLVAEEGRLQQLQSAVDQNKVDQLAAASSSRISLDQGQSQTEALMQGLEKDYQVEQQKIQTLQTDYRNAQLADQSRQQRISDAADQYAVEHEELLDLESRYEKEQKKLTALQAQATHPQS